jgi:predicted deacylase
MHSRDTPPRVDIRAPDIADHAVSAEDAPFVHVLRGTAPGPTAMITAIVHGNEICGAIALDALLRRAFRPRRGTLILAFMNVAAFERFDPGNPGASRFVDRDLNRVWDAATLVGADADQEVTRARAIRPYLDRADYLLDLHSMSGDSAAMALTGLTRKSVAMATALGAPSVLVRDAGHAEGKRMRDYGPFEIDDDGPAALLVECGQHWRRETAETALDVTARFLAWLGMSDDPPPVPAEPTVLTVTEAVTVHTGSFTFEQDYQGLERIAKAGTVIAQDGPSTVVTPYDDCVLIMPTHNCRPGQTAVRYAREIGT